MHYAARKQNLAVESVLFVTSSGILLMPVSTASCEWSFSALSVVLRIARESTLSLDIEKIINAFATAHKTGSKTLM